VWRGNRIWQTAGLGAMPPGSFLEIDVVRAPKEKDNDAPRPGTVYPLTPGDLLRLIQER
jgi:hypothetical protein